MDEQSVKELEAIVVEKLYEKFKEKGLTPTEELVLGVRASLPHVRKGKGELNVDVIFEEDSSRCAVALSFKNERNWTVSLPAGVQIDCMVEADKPEEAIKLAEELTDSIGKDVDEEGVLRFPVGAKVKWRGRSVPMARVELAEEKKEVADSPNLEADESYHTSDGKPTLLKQLVRSEPDWACNVIRTLKGKIAELEKEKEIESIWKEKK